MASGLNALSKHLFRLTILVVANTFATGVALAIPLTQHEMVFRYVTRDKLSLECERICEGWVIAEGVITDDTSRQFSEFIAEEKISPQTIYFNSTGGSFEAAVKLASIIRAYKFQTSLGRIEAIPVSEVEQQRRLALFRNHVDNGLVTDAQRGEYLSINQMIFDHAVCYDACVLAFLGGVSRSVYPGSSIGLKGEKSRTESGRFGKEISGLRAKDFHDFVMRMGADAQLMEIASDKGMGSTYFLSPQELSELRVTYDPMQATQTDWASSPYFGGLALVASEEVLPYAAKQASKNTVTIYCLRSQPKFYVFQLQSFSEVLQSMGDAEDKDGEMLTLKVSIGEFVVERDKIRFFYSHRDSNGSEVAAILVDNRPLERALEGSAPMEIKAEFPTSWGVKVDSRLKTEGIKTKLLALSNACVK